MRFDVLLRPFLEKAWFLIWTDQDMLERMFSLKNITSKLFRWHLQIIHMKLCVVHRASIETQATDTFLHLLATGESHTLLEFFYLP